MIEGITSASAICQSLMGLIDVFDQAAWLNTEYDGLFAERLIELESICTSRSIETPGPQWVKISLAKSNQDPSPLLVEL